MVQAALKANSDSFTLEHCLPSWTHRGKAVFQGGRFEREPVIFLDFSQKNWVGVCDPLPKTLTLFMTKICDFPYPIYDLTKNLIPNL